MVVYICQTQPPYSSHPTSLPTLCLQICSLCLCLCSCPENRFICTIKKKTKTITKLSQATSFWRMRYLVCHGSCPLLHLFHHKTGSLPEVRNTELHIRIPENAQVVALSYTWGARTNLPESCSGPTADPL